MKRKTFLCWIGIRSFPPGRSSAAFFFFCGLALLLGLAALPAGAADLPPAARVEGLSGNPQWHSLSCEARAAVDWARFWGVSISEDDFLAALPASDNPDEGFVGSPDGIWGYIPPNSYGVHAGPVADALQDYGLPVEAHKDLSWDDARAEIAAGRPVIVWIIGQMWAGSAREYTAADGQTTVVAAFEHTVILVGYSESTVTVVDTSSGWTLDYTLDAFLTSWATLGRMAVTGGYVDSQPPARPSAESYVVQRGDYVIELARRFGVGWEELVTLNQLAYPYTIYPGQELQIPGQGGGSEPAPAEARPIFRLYCPMIHASPQVESRAAPEAIPIATETPETSAAPRGDSLRSTAGQVGAAWERLAELNGWTTLVFCDQGRNLTCADPVWKILCPVFLAPLFSLRSFLPLIK